MEFYPSPPEEPQILNITKQSQGSSEASVPPSVFSCSGWKGSLPFPPHSFSLVLFSSPVETVTGTEYGITESQADAPKKQGAVLSALIVLGVVVAVAVATGWVCRSRCPPRDPHRYPLKVLQDVAFLQSVALIAFTLTSSSGSPNSGTWVLGVAPDVVGSIFLTQPSRGRRVRLSPSVGWECQLLNLDVRTEPFSMEAKPPLVLTRLLNSGQTQRGLERLRKAGC